MKLSLKNIKFMKQAMMRKVVYSLLPIVCAGIYFFGLRVLILLIVVTLFACLTEWVFVRNKAQKITEAVFVTAILFTMTLPPQTPYWIAIIGIIFGVLFGKMVFGGFGKNPFNPALVGRAFIYVNFPKFMTVQWTQPVDGFFGGFTSYLGKPIDAITQSTPMLIYRATGETAPLKDLLLGNIAGSIGETSALLILLMGIYLIYTKAAAKETIFSVIIGFLIMDSAFYFSGFQQVPSPIYGLMAGGILFGAVFMATDPISSPKTFQGRIIYGLMIGCITVIIRGFALFAGGIMFAILIGNTFAPILDEAVIAIKNRKKLPAKEGQ
ncbi:RnfABCDGE type electron transport complex subunit D [Fusibacter sp. 3D3]|uniref:RnfABCDGE type electron transport complex subunit D n=1 Tax=Fusibacter sp. 3D3 TaxID=1048380 RepID=UPI0008556204|nr:RnfABCDGE type electron transport complex subunit D [Fusibacter sp. 3D3]GAU79379.1 Na(+)-translocating NADH-quinone reductase subunit B [Fusibacter sp. 3D3]